MGKFSPTKLNGDCEEVANPSTAYGRRRRNFQAAMKPLDVAVAFGMVVSGAAVADAQLVQGFDIARRGELGAVVGSQSQTNSTRTERQRSRLFGFG
jgi:hypothetical protein